MFRDCPATSGPLPIASRGNWMYHKYILIKSDFKGQWFYHSGFMSSIKYNWFYHHWYYINYVINQLFMQLSSINYYTGWSIKTTSQSQKPRMFQNDLNKWDCIFYCFQRLDNKARNAFVRFLVTVKASWRNFFLIEFT